MPFMGTPTLALSATAVTPDDAAIIPTTKALYVGTIGDLTVVLSQDTAPVTFVDVVGWIPVMAQMVMATDTTATDILALY